MEVTFIEKHNYNVDIDLNAIKHCIKIDLEKKYQEAEISSEMIYSAFIKNPEYYLTHLGYLSKLSDVNDNYTVIKTIMDKFFIFCMQNTQSCFYVLEGSEVLASYEDKDIAKLYAHRMNGYIIEVK